METWTKHITGATALLKLRGKEPLTTPLGYALFVQVKTQSVSLFCLSKSLAT